MQNSHTSPLAPAAATVLGEGAIFSKGTDAALGQTSHPRGPVLRAPRPTHVHPSETTSQEPPPIEGQESGKNWDLEDLVRSSDETVYQRISAGPRRFKRLRLIDRLGGGDDERLLKLRGRLKDCCRFPQILLMEDGRVARAAARCHKRICPICSHLYAKKLATKAKELTKGFEVYRLMTLTIAHTQRPLRVQIKALQASFRKLRRSMTWRKYVTGGVAVLEITYNQSRGEWHPHLHVIPKGEFFPHQELKAAWAAASPGARNVHVEALHSAGGVAAYVSGYITKSSDAASFPEEALAEWASSVSMVRMFTSFGCLHAKKTDTPTPPRPKTKDALCSLHVLADQAWRGMLPALPLFTRLANLPPFPAPEDLSVAAIAARQEHAALAVDLKSFQADYENRPSSVAIPPSIPPPSHKQPALPGVF